MSTCVSSSVRSASPFDSANSLARWSRERANRWYAELPWLVGCNYIPASASNQLEMWQAETFDLERIDLELSWAEKIGLNVMRVFLHDLLWEEDAAGFSRRIDEFLGVASKHRIAILFVLFDSCWHPHPQLGAQLPPVTGVHNSRWVQSPGRDALCDPQAYPRLRRYVSELVRRFADDPRVLAWDLWNEPDNDNSASYPELESADKLEWVNGLLPQVFEWARSANPTQPLTSGLWIGNWSTLEGLTPIQRTQVQQSDVISFHNYEGSVEFEKRIAWLQDYGRPLLCTEYMARSCGSTFEQILPIARAQNVAAVNWGFVAGKTQTYMPWDSWQKPYVEQQPSVWFHEILRTDGSAYETDEVEAIRQLTKPAVKTMAARAGK